MEKVFYVSRKMGAAEYVLCHFGSDNFEFINVIDEATVEGYRFETTDREEAQGLCDIHAEWNGSVECFERIAR